MRLTSAGVDVKSPSKLSLLQSRMPPGMEQGPRLYVGIKGDQVILTRGDELRGKKLDEVAQAIRDGGACPAVLDNISLQLRAQRSSFDALGLSPEQVKQAKQRFEDRDIVRTRAAVLSGRADPWTIKSRREKLLGDGMTPEQLETGEKKYFLHLAQDLARSILEGRELLEQRGEELMRLLDQAERTFDDVGLDDNGLKKAWARSIFGRERQDVLSERGVEQCVIDRLCSELRRHDCTMADLDLTEAQVRESARRYKAAMAARKKVRV